MQIETSAIHRGVLIDNSYNSVTTPIYPSSNFFFNKIGETNGFDYTRSGNPTRKALELNLASLENGIGASATSSGMSAVTAVLSLFKAGDHVITTNDIYGGTHRLMAHILPRYGVEVSFLSTLNNPDLLKRTLKQNTRLVWIETPSNPLLNITDIQFVSEFVKSEKPDTLLVADNTFLSPYFQKPLDLGCDIVMHSTTKYLNGHSDVIGGVVISKTEELAKEIAYNVNCMGLACSPFDAWLVLRGVKTLPQRMIAHQANAFKLAEYLVQHPLVKKLYFTGDPSHPQAEIIARQMTGHGGMLALKLDLSKADINLFFKNLKYFILAESLGGIESLIEQPWSMSHASMDEAARLEAGLDPSVVRISAGIENSSDLIADLDQAFASCC
ncbi:MAG: PLP-dependent aspartate aminotransferase family protein [Candidatus Caenarcaniphilales bacterium]|nr:PLP-dependent aspartate aminotransferase family protein [Candidatus Caenarcaniphilales bacterium]